MNYLKAERPGSRQVAKKNNIIEINGQRYDAYSGEVLSGAAPIAAPRIAEPAKEPAALPSVKTSRKPAKHVRPHTPVTSHTLMRQAVKKPNLSSKHPKAHGHTDSLATKPLASVIVKKPLHRPDDKLLQRAKRIPKSQLISHFLPAEATAPRQSVQETPAPGVGANKTTDQPVKAAAPILEAKKPRTTSELLEHALKHANSHEQRPVKPRQGSTKTRRRAGIAGAAVLGIGLIGLVAMQNLPNAQLQLASAKAGFDASMPQNLPSGFSKGALSYSTGAVAAKFHSNSDDRAYTINQKRSSWNIVDLRDNFVAPADKNFQTVETEDLIVFLYGSHNATWLKDGIWYVVQSGGALSDRQLVDLAIGM